MKQSRKWLRKKVNECVTDVSDALRRAKTRKKRTEKELLKGITPAMCGPELIRDRKGNELL